MLEDPELPIGELSAALRGGFGVEGSDWRFVPGYDLRAATYSVDGRWFAKVRFGPIPTAPLHVPAALAAAGVVNVLPPIPTPAGRLWQPMGEDRSLVVVPFVAGRNAMEAGMTREQWIAFGAALRAVHESATTVDLPTDAFALPAADAVRASLDEQAPDRESAAIDRLASVLAEREDRIGQVLERATVLGERLRRRTFERVLCHADIHAANVLVADDGRIFLVDWDGPMRAPRERDLLFVIGSRIARSVSRDEEAWFFSGYGWVDLDPEAIVFYRYERILEDIGEFARSVREDEQSEPSRLEQIRMFESFFEPGGILEDAERVRIAGY
jgi:spectinomycin phosphotransferase